MLHITSHREGSISYSRVSRHSFIPVNKAGLFFVRTILTLFSSPFNAGEQARLEQNNYKAATMLKKGSGTWSWEGEVVQHLGKLLFPFALVCPSPQRREGGLGYLTEPHVMPVWWLLINAL